MRSHRLRLVSGRPVCVGVATTTAACLLESVSVLPRSKLEATPTSHLQFDCALQCFGTRCPDCSRAGRIVISLLMHEDEWLARGPGPGVWL
eukprot:6202995-Pleurochrysis_carterae.AAC.1